MPVSQRSDNLAKMGIHVWFLPEANNAYGIVLLRCAVGQWLYNLARATGFDRVVRHTWFPPLAFTIALPSNTLG
jgi:hypothetical protein